MILKLQNAGRTIISSQYYFRVGLAVSSSFLIERTDSSIVLSNISGMWLLINAVTIYLLLLVVDQLSIAFEVGATAKFASCGPIFSRVLIGLVFPMLPGLVFAMAYFICIDLSISEMTTFMIYLLKITATLVIFNAKLICSWRDDESLTISPDLRKTTFTSGSSDNYLDIAYIFKENDSYFAYDFESGCVSWPETPVASFEKLPHQHFYLLNEELIINKRAISRATLFNDKVVIHLINGFELTDQLTQEAITNFQMWLEKKCPTNGKNRPATRKTQIGYSENYERAFPLQHKNRGLIRK